MKSLILISAIAAVATAHAATRPELLGRWVHVKCPSMRVEITDNASSFIITEFSQDQVKKHPAKLTGGVLIANTGPCSRTVDIEKTSCRLLLGGQEYRRLRSGEPFEAVKKGPARF